MDTHYDEKKDMRKAVAKEVRKDVREVKKALDEGADPKKVRKAVVKEVKKDVKKIAEKREEEGKPGLGEAIKKAKETYAEEEFMKGVRQMFFLNLSTEDTRNSIDNDSHYYSTDLYLQ